MTPEPVTPSPDPAGRVPWGAVATFTLVSMALAWVVALPAWLCDPDSARYPLIFSSVAAAMMFTPAIAMLIVVFAVKTPRTERARFLGLWPLRPARSVIGLTAVSLVAPALIIGVVVAVSAAAGLVALDLTNFSGFVELTLSQVPEGMRAAVEDPAELVPNPGLIVALQLALIPLGALFNGVVTIGEEIGWRGWLLPALRPVGTWPALALSGAIWGLWHSPLILLGYNFGYTDWRGVGLMIGGCIAWGVLLGWTRLRTGSVWPAVFGHGSLNAAGALVLLFAAAGAEPNMAVVGPLGFLAWAVIAVIVIVLVATGQFSREGELAARKRPRTPRPAPTAGFGEFPA